ncbi:FG-GAP-like repeat-containing protein [Paenibacillus arenosi]|uniref:VCBS repeat-containing protein n=1 Tax=Paenibacillus arenosi TaxID=2774142 RepID=A0ABR9B0X9_9BACL|nr:FG-GAP-like repeat-containing protein [Paenibacillus arenosi]MBD8500050.1 VCBS repeat-containing protein [Paenibacillus arenosi]
MSKSSYYRRISLMLSVLMMLTIALPPNLVQAQQQKAQPQQVASISNEIFKLKHQFAQSQKFEFSTVGDLDGNNVSDFVELNNRAIEVSKNQIDGTTVKEVIQVPAPHIARLIQLSDIIGDSRLEIINIDSEGIVVFSMNNSGSYELKHTISIPPSEARNYVQSFVIVDFDNDKVKDIILSNGSHVQYYKGGSNLSFEKIGEHKYNNYYEDSYIRRIATGDWNGDGIVDFAFVNYQGPHSYVFSFTGQGDGSFQQAAVKDIGIEAYEKSFLDIKDVDQDGLDDIVFNPPSNELLIYHGDKKSTFQRVTTIDFTQNGDIVDLSDYNGDGYVDFMVKENNSWSLYWNHNGQKTVPAFPITFPSNYYEPKIFTDFNMDGKTDIIGFTSAFIEVFINMKPLEGRIQFESREQFVSENRKTVQVKVVRTGGSKPHTKLGYQTKNDTALAGKDYLYKKGILEFQAGETEAWISIPRLGSDIPSEGRNFSIHLSQPNAGDTLGRNSSIMIHIQDDNTTPPVDTAPNWPRDGKLVIRDVSSSSLTAAWPAALDSNGIEAYEISEVHQALPTKTVTADVYSHTWTSGLQGGKVYQFQVVAVDTLGEKSEPLSEVVTIGDTSTLPEKNFNYLKYLYSKNWVKSTVFTADIDGNGIEDFVTESHDKTYQMLNYAEVLPTEGIFVASGTCRGSIHSTADWNRNGIADFIYRHDTEICIVEANMTNASSMKKTTLTLPNVTALRVADFSDDGITDILYSTIDHKLVLLQGSTNYTFTEIARSQATGSLYEQGSGDWNGDGKEDIVVVSTNNKLTAYTNQGDGTFAKAVQLRHASLTSVTTEDFDKDGYDDIVALSKDNIEIYYGDASSSFLRSKSLREDRYHIKSIIAHDINQDSQPDLLLITHTAFKVLLNENGTFSFSSTLLDKLNTFGPSRSMVSIGDFTGDGKLDVSIADASYLDEHFLYTANYSSSTFQFGQEVIKVQEHAGQVQLQLKRVGDRQSVTSVVYETVDGTGLAAVDYVASTGVLTFAAGETEKTITIPVIDNNRRNAERSFTVKLSSPTRGAKLGSPSQIVVQIEDDEQDPPQWSVGAALMPLDVTSSSMTLSWPAAKGKEDITNYLITEKNGLLPPVSVPCYVLAHRWSTGLLAGGTYQFEVRAKNKKGSVSEPLTKLVTLPTVEVPPIDPPDELPPQWPAGASLHPSNVDESTLTLSWPAAIGANAILAYELRETNGALAPVSVTGQVYSHTWNSGLEAGKTYQFELKARDAKGLPSAPLLTVVTLPDVVVPPIDPPVTVPVKAPQWSAGAIVQYKDVSESTLTLLWPAAVDTDGVAAYRIRETSNVLSPVTVTGQVYSHTWSSGLTAGKTYQFEVTAQDKTGLTGVPLIVKVTLPNQPSVQPRKQPSYGGPIGGAALSSNKAVASVQLFEQGKHTASEAVWSQVAGRYEFTTVQEQIEMEVKPDHKAATVWIDSKQWEGKKQLPLKLGQNEFKFTVKAENGDKSDYTLFIVRKETSDRPDKQDSSMLKPCLFLDVSEHWAGARICEAYAQGLVQGITDAAFKPEQTLTRAEFAVLLARLSGVEAKQVETLRFKDSGHIAAWAIAAVKLAVEKGWIVGYEDGTFRPEEQVSRAELAAIVARVMEWDTVSEEQGKESAFQDAAAIPDWAKRSVLALQKHGVIQGKKDGRYAPAEAITRAEAATLLLRLKKLIDSK